MIAASLEAYLQSLQESGLDGIPAGLAGEIAIAPSPAATQTAVRPEPGPEPETSAAAIVERETLETVGKDLGNCLRCGLGQTRKNLVFGMGNPQARLVFVGEGPGADEDLQGQPFVGEAGQVLNRIISAMGLKREEVYICNVVKCRPPGNRDPLPDEIAACSPFLLRQLQSIRPEAVVALGKFAAQTLLETKEPISRIRGRFRDYHGIPLMPTYHPSFLMRRQKEGSLDAFWEVWDDMAQVLRLLKLPVPEKSRKR
ncbi:uracil-DNA glycosylase [Geobacter sp. SVR]|uniref:uracil-DNA glycosylase n=1 Tax=Geobacter sp. SVR TaxID=2495594 RepID=UPI00156693F0